METMKQWSGKWIWSNHDKIANSYYMFRKEFHVTKAQGVTLDITGDTRYKVYVNGEYVGYGPIQSQPYRTYYDCYDLEKYLLKEVNVISIIVYYSGHIEGSRPGLLAEIKDKENTVIAKTDETFKVLKGDCWDCESFGLWINRYAPNQEFFDARLEPSGWKVQGFVDEGWQEAVVIKGFESDEPPAVGPWSVIMKRPIPFMETKEVIPKTFVNIGECLYIQNRFRKNDLTLSLSQAVSEKKHSLIEGLDDLCRDDDSSLDNVNEKGAVVKGAMDGVYGGVYNPTFIVDFGKVITAFFEIEVEASAGVDIEIGYAERLIDGQFNNALECSFADQYTTLEGKQTFRSFNWRGYRYVKLVFKNASEPVMIKAIRGIVTRYPFKDNGRFLSSDSQLNQVYEACRETIRLCSNESIMDTPWREQSQWTGDAAAVTIGGIYACFGDTLLPGKFYKQSAMNQYATGMLMNITNVVEQGYMGSMVDYNFWWVIGVWNHYMYTGEELLIHEMYPIITKMLFNIIKYSDEDGLLSNVPYRLLLDWANHDRKGTSTILNAIYKNCLEIIGKMAKIKGDSYIIELVETQGAKIDNAFVKRFYNEELTCFVDGDYMGVQSRAVSETANALAVYFNCCGEEVKQAVIHSVFVENSIEGIVEAQPFMTYYVLKMLIREGYLEKSIEIIKMRWYERMICKGATSTYEEWSENGSYRNGEFLSIIRSHSHAWSAGAAEFLIKDLCGVEITEAGGKCVQVNPIVTTFDYDITYPLMDGWLKVACDKGQIKVNSSKNVKVMMDE